ncbi:sodium-coupled neutral amino acid transporter 5 isoform 1-T1 [Sarcophilus harrisii]
MELVMGEPRMNGLVPRGPPEPEQSQAELAGFLPRPPLGKQAVQFSDFEGKTSLGMSIFNLSNAIMGSGILGLAYAMSNTGVLLFLVLLLCMALLSAYSIHLLLTCAGFVGIRAYEELGRRAFGISGNVAVAGVICLHNIGAMSSYLYIIKSELPLVIETFLDSKTTDPSSPWFLDGNVLIVLVSVGIVLPLALMRHLGYLGYTSGLSLTCMVFFLASVIYKKFSMECPLTSGNWTTGPAQDLNDTCEVQFFTINSQTAYTIPILAFAFVCHPEVLPIYTELRRPSQRRMQAVANMSIGAMFLMYGLTATFGYLTFFGHVEAEMLHMYSQDLLILCVRLAVLMAVTLTIPVVLFPIRRAIQQLLFPTKAFSWTRHGTIALVLLALVNVLVIFVPDIRDIFGVIGATSAPSLIFILPSIFYIRIIPREREALTSRPKLQATAFTALGVVIMAMSLGFIFTDWAVTGQSRGTGH